MTIPARIAAFFRTMRLRRLLLWGSLALFVGLLLVGALVVALPTIASSPSVQTRLQQALTRSLNRQVTWSHLALSWSDGMAIKGLALGSGAAPLLKGAVGEATVVPTIGYVAGRWRLDLDVRIRTITAQLAPGPPKPPKPYQEPLTAIAEALQEVENMDWPLPLDFGVQVAVEPVTLAYMDPQNGRQLTLNNCMLRLHMPSLADQPVTAEFRGELAVDGHPLEALALTADLKRLVTSARRIHPAAALVAIKATMPGTSLTMQGGLHEVAGFALRTRLDLPRLQAVAAPFLPPTAPTIQGELTLDLQATVDAARNLHGDLALAGSRISVSGGRLRHNRVGPLHLQLRQKVVADHQHQQVRFTDGGITIGSLLAASWEATVDRPASRDRDLTARLGPARVDLRQALAVAAPLLPPQMPLKDLSGQLVLQQLAMHLQGRKQQGEVTLTGLGVSLPRLRLALAKGDVVADGVDVTIDNATMPLADRQPTRVDAALSYALRRETLSGAQPLVLDGIRGGLRVALTELNFKTTSPRKIVATADLQQSLDIRQVNLKQQLTVATLHEQLTAKIKALESGEIAVTLPELTVSAAALQAMAAGKQLKPVPLTATATVNGMRLPATKGEQLALDHAACTITGGDFLQLAATAGLSSGTPQLATTAGALRVELDRFLPLAAPLLPKGVTGAGATSLAWNLRAPLVQQPLPKEPNPLRRAKATLAMVEQGEVTVSLANRAITWPLATGKITVGELRSSTPLRLVVPGKGGNVRFDGDLVFTGLNGLPGEARQLPPQSGVLSLRGELADWRSLRLHEELRIQPLGLVQQANATISRIDALLEKQDAITRAALLQHLDATLLTTVTAHFPPTLTPFPGGVELSGESSAEVRIILAAGHHLQVHATAATRDFGLRLKNGTTVEGVRADLLLDRTYDLAKGEATSWTPLSVSLVRPAPLRQTSAGAAEIVNRVREDLRGQEQGSRKFTIRRIATRSGQTPLEFTSVEGDLLLTPEEMGLSFFQAEVLGGSVRLRGLIDLKTEIPSVAADCSFTNLETFLLLPPETRQKSGTQRHDTEITGELSFAAPLVTGQRELLEGIRMRLNLRKIGADTLERTLFSLDPYERNEQLVAQRKQLRHGTLKSIRASTLDGSFSLDGEMQVKGIDISIPKVERIRLADLQLQKQMAKTVTGIAKARQMLDLVRADTLVVGPKGELSLARRGHE